MLGLGSPDILRERCRFAYGRTLAAAGGTLALSLTLSVFLWRSRPLEQVLFWQAVMLSLVAALAALGWAYRRSDKADDPAIWTRRLALCATALGAGWGYAAAAFFPGSEGEQGFMAFIVAVVSAGALPVFSTLWWIYALYAGAVMLPFTI